MQGAFRFNDLPQKEIEGGKRASVDQDVDKLQHVNLMLAARLEQPERRGEEQPVQRTPKAVDGVRPVATQERLANLHIRDAIDVAHVASVDPYVRDADGECYTPHNETHAPKSVHIPKRRRVRYFDVGALLVAGLAHCASPVAVRDGFTATVCL